MCFILEWAQHFVVIYSNTQYFSNIIFKMKDSTENVIKISFLSCCLVLAGYMVSIQFLRYISNEDVSASFFKRFNLSPIDLYPTYSICFKDTNGGIFDDTNIQDYFSLGNTKEIGRKYSDALAGIERKIFVDSALKENNFFCKTCLTWM